MAKEPGTYDREKTISAVNGIGEMGRPHGKQWNWTTILHHTPKSTQNGLKTWTITVVGESRGISKLLDISFGGEFLYLTPKWRQEKQK